MEDLLSMHVIGNGRCHSNPKYSYLSSREHGRVQQTDRARTYAALKHAGEDGLLPMQHYNL